MFKRDNLADHKVISLLISAFFLVAILSGCALTTSDNTTTTATTADGGTASETTVPSGSSSVDAPSIPVKWTDEDQNTAWDAATAAVITFQGDAIAAADSVTVDGSSAIITAAGTYVVSGNLNNGQIIIRAGEDDVVRIVLGGTSITNAAAAPVSVETAKKVVLILADGTLNSIDFGNPGSTFNTGSASEDPNAAIYSMADLTINGSGSLTVTSYAGHGIVSKDKLKILGGVISVTSAGDGIKGRDYVAVSAGTVSIDAGSDGMDSNNDEDAAQGFVYISGGAIDISAESKGIQAETSILISGGSFNVNSADDTINANGSISISGGTFSLSSGDDGIHADAAVTIDGGTLTIKESYEGIESAVITVNAGTINLTASDDGFNVAGGNDNSAAGGQFGGKDNFSATEGCYLYINGGYIVIDAGGDGLDSNGSFYMTGGTAIVDGPTNDGNGAIDYNGTFQITGGYLLAVGSSGMAEAPDTSSTQYAILVGLNQAMSAGTLIHIEDTDGNNILTYQPSKQYSSIAFSSPDLTQGATINVYTGGSSTGNETDGLYSDGTYSGGTLQATLSLSSILTTSGSSGGMNPGGGMKPGGGGHRP